MQAPFYFNENIEKVCEKRNLVLITDIKDFFIIKLVCRKHDLVPKTGVFKTFRTIKKVY